MLPTRTRRPPPGPPAVSSPTDSDVPDGGAPDGDISNPNGVGMFTGMSTGFDPRRHPRGLDGRFAPAPPAEDPDIGLAAALADPPHPPPEPVQAADPEERAHAALISTDPELLDRLGVDVDWQVRQTVAKNPSTSVRGLSWLADDHEELVREAAAANPSTSPRSLMEIATRDPVELVAVTAVTNPSFGPEGFAAAARSRSPKVRCAAATRAECPASVLTRLAGDRNSAVRHAVAANPGAPGDVLDRLAAGSPSERHAVAANPGAPDRVLDWLAVADPDEAVRTVAAATLEKRRS